MLLGPDEWRTSPPALKDDSSRPVPFATPKECRQRLSTDIRDATTGRLHAFLMQPSGQQPGEDHDDYFVRLENDHHVVAYFFIIPPGCKLSGMLIEQGMLLRDFRYGSSPDIRLFPHKAVAAGSYAHGFRFTERGNRTRYMESLATKARRVVMWRNWNGLRDAVLKQARELAES